MALEMKNAAGRKGNAEAKDLQTCISKAEWEMRKFDAGCCNDLKALYEMQRDMAFGTGKIGKACSPSNRKTSIDQMIARGESYATGTAELLLAQGGVEGEVEEQVTIKQVGNGSNVVELSYPEKLAAYKALQAEKV